MGDRPDGGRQRGVRDQLSATTDPTTDDPTTDDEIVEFTRAALAFLEANARRKPPCDDRWGVGSDRINTSGTIGDAGAERAELAAAQAWRQKVFDAGFGWLGGPREYGGAGRDRRLDAIYNQLEAEFDVPNQAPIRTATNTVAPAVEAFGSHELKLRYLRGMHRGEVQTCQLLSEPEAGSDLASLRTTAVRDGESWVVNGQKVWSSYAHLAQVGQVLARTDPSAPKHRGLTMFIVDMATPGIEVRPLRQVTGEAHFNEVFLTDVRIPDTNRVGEPGAGWQAIQATFSSERSGIGSGTSGNGSGQFERLLALYRHRGDAGDRVLRQRMADVWAHQRLNTMLTERLRALAAAGRLHGPEGSMLKLASTRQMAWLSEIASAVLGPALVADTGEWGTYCWADWVCGAPGWRIAGGTDEIQRNILAERLLRLPREPLLRRDGRSFD